MTHHDLAIRVQRLEDLSRRLAREITVWRNGGDLLLYVERRTYLSALHEAFEAIEKARVLMSQARRRVEQVE